MTKFKIAYYSLTGNVRHFVNKHLCDYELIDIEEGNVDEPFVLITPTYDFGQVPEVVDKWLIDNGKNIIGVISSGNKNWGKFYGKAGDSISAQYGVPLIAKFELRGTDEEGQLIKRKLNERGDVIDEIKNSH